MYHVSRFWPFVTVLYTTKMHPTSENYCFPFFKAFKIILKKNKIFVAIRLCKLHFSIWKCELQCKNWYETYIFYFTIVFVTPYSPQKISPRVSIMTKKINKTLSFINWVYKRMTLSKKALETSTQHISDQINILNWISLIVRIVFKAVSWKVSNCLSKTMKVLFETCVVAPEW